MSPLVWFYALSRCLLEMDKDKGPRSWCLLIFRRDQYFSNLALLAFWMVVCASCVVPYRKLSRIFGLQVIGNSQTCPRDKFNLS